MNAQTIELSPLTGQNEQDDLPKPRRKIPTSNHRSSTWSALAQAWTETMTSDNQWWRYSLMQL